MNTLRGRTVLVTGASGGIGRAIVQRLAGSGARVVAHHRSQPEAVASALSDYAPRQAHLVRADLGAPDGAEDLWQQAVDWAGRIDVVVLNAASMPRLELTEDDATWDQVVEQTFRVNTLSQLSLVRRALLHFEDHGPGTLIGLSSVVAHRGAGHANLMTYAASKAAVTAALKTVAATHAARGVLTYQIAPGSVDTEMSAAAAADRGGLEPFLQALAMREMVPPSEVAELVAFLASGQVRHLTGATLDINGASYIR